MYIHIPVLDLYIYIYIYTHTHTHTRLIHQAVMLRQIYDIFLARYHHRKICKTSPYFSAFATVQVSLNSQYELEPATCLSDNIPHLSMARNI